MPVKVGLDLLLAALIAATPCLVQAKGNMAAKELHKPENVKKHSHKGHKKKPDETNPDGVQKNPE
jgi:hypothetical protein